MLYPRDFTGLPDHTDVTCRTMTSDEFSAETLDDVLRYVSEAILRRGQDISPTQGPAKEITGVLLAITNPLSRISRTETRARPFSCLGELFWYLSKSNDLSFISYYLPKYRSFANGTTIHGGYGPRLFDWHGIDQFSNVAELLARNRDSRRARNSAHRSQRHRRTSQRCSLHLHASIHDS